MKTPQQLAEDYLFGEDGGIYSVPVPESRKSLDRQIFKAGYEAAQPKWISVEDEKPELRHRVLVVCKNEYEGKTFNFTTIAEFVPKMTIPEQEFMDEEWWSDGDYDEQNDTYFTPDGWYEWQSEPEVNYKITAKVTHWMPLTAPPKTT